MPETISLGLLVVNRSILLVKQAYGKYLWTLPGGVVENNETIAQAVVREVIEETGLVTQAKGIVSLRNRTDQTVVVFELEIKSGRLLDSVAGENVQVDTQTNIVNAVWLLPNDSISLGEIIEKYGEPNFVTVDQETPGTIHPRFYWNSIRMLVLLPKISGEAYDVEKTTEVEGIDFSDENLYRASEKESDPYYKPWNGYGMYQPTEPFPSITTPIATATMAP